MMSVLEADRAACGFHDRWRQMCGAGPGRDGVSEV